MYIRTGIPHFVPAPHRCLSVSRKYIASSLPAGAAGSTENKARCRQKGKTEKKYRLLSKCSSEGDLPAAFL